MGTELNALLLIPAAVCLYVPLHAKAAGEWQEHTGSCYSVYSTSTTYPGAGAACQSLGTESRQAELEGPGELLAVNQVLGTASRQYWVATLKTGLSSYKWATAGTVPEAWLWKDQEPNDSGDCVRLVRYFDTVDATGALTTQDLGQFWLADHLCDNAYLPLCERPASVAAAYIQRLTSLPSKLCAIESFVTSGLIECAVLCTRTPSCFVYGYSRAGSLCTFHCLLNQCPTTAAAATTSSAVSTSSRNAIPTIATSTNTATTLYFQIARLCP